MIRQDSSREERVTSASPVSLTVSVSIMPALTRLAPSATSESERVRV